MSERDIFVAALRIEHPAERDAYLDQVCAGDAALRQRIGVLLEAHGHAGPFLEKPAVEGIAAARRSQERTKADHPVPPRVEAGADPFAHLQDVEPTQTRPLPGEDDDPPLDFLSPSSRPGSLGRLGHYEIVRVVGHGGMGIVLKAFDENLHRVVAIKVLAPQFATSATARKRFLREARAAAAVAHDNVVTIHAVEEGEGIPYLVMQFVAGLSLQDKVDREGPLGLNEVLRIGMQMAAGLAAAHAQGLIHRDIKPANILLENSIERVRITDFGLARTVDDASLTQSGAIAGTPQYMSPEQAEGKHVDHRSDLFSLGSVLYILCTGRPPFRAPSTMGVLRRVCEESPRPIRESNPEVPDYLAAIVEKLHAKDPAARFQSATEVAGLLSRHLADLQQPALAPPPRPRRRRWAVAGLLLLLLAGGLAVTEATGVTRLLLPGGLALSGQVTDPPQPTPQKPAAAEKEFANSAGMRLRLIPPGEFVMGSPSTEVGHTDEEYAHRVQITRPFYLGVHEVTQEVYRRMTGSNPSWFSPTGGGKDRAEGLSTGRLPVDSVSWDDAVAFCHRLSELPEERAAGRVYRLPTEAEWEYACRAGTETALHYGNSLSGAQANFDCRSPYGSAERGSSLQRTGPVGMYGPNVWGLHDVHGNVWEWCADAYAADYYRESPVKDPRLDSPGDLRVLRGGSWYSNGAACRAAFRHKLAHDARSYHVGFRVVCNAP